MAGGGFKNGRVLAASLVPCSEFSGIVIGVPSDTRDDKGKVSTT